MFKCCWKCMSSVSDPLVLIGTIHHLALPWCDHSWAFLVFFQTFTVNEGAVMFVINDTIKKVMKTGACCSVPDGKFPLSIRMINIYGRLIAPAPLTPRTRLLEPSNYVCCSGKYCQYLIVYIDSIQLLVIPHLIKLMRRISLLSSNF